jgi:hypothetical protein
MLLIYWYILDSKTTKLLGSLRELATFLTFEQPMPASARKKNLYSIGKFLQLGTRIFHRFGVSC